jgi:hypothetical protein
MIIKDAIAGGQEPELIAKIAGIIAAPSRHAAY